MESYFVVSLYETCMLHHILRRDNIDLSQYNTPIPTILKISFSCIWNSMDISKWKDMHNDSFWFIELEFR